MESSANYLEPLYEKAAAFGKTSIVLIKLQALEKLTVIIPLLLSRLIVALAGCCFLLLCSVGLALWLGDWLGKAYYGFLVVGALYGIAGIILSLFLHGWIKTPVRNAVIKVLA